VIDWLNKKEKYKQEKKEASYKKQKEASDKVNILCSAKIYNVFWGALGSGTHMVAGWHSLELVCFWDLWSEVVYFGKL